MSNWLRPVEYALDAAQAPVEIFFRDDDVGWDDTRLWTLLDLFGERSLPLDLAVIPADLSDRLAEELVAKRESPDQNVAFHQHGWTHSNHEATGRKYEFGPSRDTEAQLRDIAAGRQRLVDALGRHVEPIFTPPWNRCTRDTAHCLLGLGFQVLSREARTPAFNIPGLVELPVRVDWLAHRNNVRLTLESLGELMAAALTVPGPTGIMFHHAAMDAADSRAAAELLTLLSAHPRVNAQTMMAAAGRRSAIPTPS